MRIFKRVALTLSVTFLSVLFFFGFWIHSIDRSWSPLIEPRIKERQQFGSIRILAQNSEGKEIWLASLTSGRLEERKPVNLSEVPPLLVQAVVMLEDPRFLSHEGFDIWGILRASFAVIRTMRFSQGGSTITQQLVKNIFLSQEKTLKRKFIEIVLAAIVEKRFTKDEILEAYLNEIYMGQVGPLEIHGVGRAAEYYFDKPLDSLEIHEIALLAAVIASPGYYSPWKNPDRALSRRKRVLNTLREADHILEEEYTQADAAPLPPPSNVSGPTRAHYVVDALRSQLVLEKGEEALLKGGFDIRVSIDLELQQIAEKNLREFSANAEGTEALAIGVNPYDCSIVVYAGGADYKKSQFDRIRMSSRSIGSLMKPLELLRVLDNPQDTLNLASVLEDRPLDWSYDKGRGTWSPKNYDGKFRGPLRLRQALEESINVPIARIFFERHPDGLLNEVFAPLRAMNLNIPPERALPSALLGAIEQRPWDVATAYTKMVRQAMGLATDPADFRCRLHFEKQNMEEPIDEISPHGQLGSWLMIQALQGGLRRGTSRSLGSQVPTNQAWAGKTGTSSDQKDSWYVALSPSFVLLTWVGRDDNTATKFTGASGALKIASPIVVARAKREDIVAGWSWAVPEQGTWEPIEKERSCKVGGFPADDFRNEVTPPTDPQTGLPAERIYSSERTFVWEFFQKEKYPPECS